MNFELKKVTWNPENMPDTPQTLSLSFRSIGMPDIASSYTLVTENLYVLPGGVVVNPPVIKGLINNSTYVFRLTNSASGDTLDVTYATPAEMICPKIDNYYTPNARIDYVQEDGNFFAGMVPNGLAFYSLENDFRELIGDRTHPQTSSGTYTLRTAQGHTGAYLDSKEYGMATDLKMSEILAGNAAGAYALGAYFYITATDLPATGKWPLLSCLDGNGYGVIVYVDNVTKEIVWEQKNATLTQTARSTSPILLDTWNNILVGSFSVAAGSPLQNFMYLNGTGVISGAITAASIPSTFDTYTTLSFGGSPYFDSSNDGKGIFRNVFVSNAASVFTNNGSFNQLTSPVGYLRSYYNSSNIFTIPHENMIEVSRTKVGFTIPQDVPPGRYDFYVRYNGITTTPISIQVLEVNAPYNDFEYDFSADTGATTMFQLGFYPVGESEGTADGGVAPKNLYFKDNLLVMEAHGDWYDGQVHAVGIGGATKLHTNPLDLLYGESWKTRVGAAVATRGYYGYGSYIVEAKLPKQIGVTPFFGIFHNAKVKFQDPYYEQCLGRGLHPQGDTFGSDWVFTVVKNELAMELPAIASLGDFFDFDTLLSNTFHAPYAGMKVRMYGSDAENSGIFQLDVPSAPNDRASWSLYSNDLDSVSQPRRDHIVLRNAKGELGVGLGFNSEGIEEFLEMHASIGKDVWDDEYHQFRMDWYADRVEYYIDGTLIQKNSYFVPDIVGRFSFGLKFPTAPMIKSPWVADPSKSTNGFSTWHHQSMVVRKVKFTPFTDDDAGGTLKLLGETDPYGRLYNFPILAP